MSICKDCKKTFVRSGNRQLRCRPCIKIDRRRLDREQKLRNRKDVIRPCRDCGTDFKVLKNAKYCDECTFHECKTDDCTILVHRSRKFCDGCRVDRSRKAYKELNERRKLRVMEVKENKPEKELINPKYLERGKKLYAGYTSL